MSSVCPRGIAMVISNFYPEVGGAEKQAHLLSDLLFLKGIPIFVLTRNYLGSRRREMVGGLDVVRSPAIRSMRIFSSILFIMYSLFFILRNRKKIEIIHCHQSFSPMTIGGLSYFLFGIPYIVKITASNDFGEANELEKLPFLGIRKKFLKNASRFLVVNHQIISELSRFGVPESKCIWVPNGVKMPTDEHDWPRCRRDLREKMQVAEADPVFVFSGRLSAEKGLLVLLSSFKKLLAHYPNSRLWILGDGGVVRNIEEDLKKQVSISKMENLVHFFGRVSDVSPFLIAADIFVLLSVSEGMSNSVLEAMAHRLPVLVTNISAMEEVVLEGLTGCKVAVGSESETLAAMLKMVNDREKMKQMANQSQALARGKFSIEQVASTIVGIYQDVLNGAK